MKRLLSILLALVMLACPLGALADAMRYTLRLQATPEEMRAVMEDMLSNPEVQELMGVDAAMLTDDTLLAMAASLVNASALEATLQDNGLRLALSMSNTELVDVAFTWDKSEIAMTSSMLPKLMLCIPLQELETAAATVDWAALTSAMEEEAFAWLMTRNQTYETGSYASATFDDAVEIVRFELDDTDVALLVEGLLLKLEEEQALAELIDRSLGAGSMQQFFHEARSYNYEAAKDNHYAYVLTMAYAENDVPAGVTLVCTSQGQQIWQASAMLSDEKVQVILGVSVNGSVNYFAYTVTAGVAADASSMNTQEFAVYQAEADQTFDEAAANSQNALIRVTGMETTRMQNTADGLEAHTDSQMTAEQNGVQIYVQESKRVTTYKANSSDWKMADSTSINGIPTGKLMVEAAACEPFAMTVNSETKRLNLADEAVDFTEYLSDALYEGEQLLKVRLLKGLPADLLQLFVQQMLVNK